MALARAAVVGKFTPVKHRYAWLWDVDMNTTEFDALLSGLGENPLEKRQWAVLRLIEYAPFKVRQCATLLQLSAG
jgi:hypothetical protein